MQTIIRKNIIKAFGRDVEQDVIALHEETAEVIKEHQIRFVPVETGALRDSIRIEKRGERIIAILEGGGEVDYALYQEYGTDRQSGTPHIRPAFQMGVRHLLNGLGRLKGKYS